MNEIQREWLESTAVAAEQAGHIFPDFAACEAALETGYGEHMGGTHNLFGTKQHLHPIYSAVSLSTKEVLHGVTVNQTAPFINYPNDAASYTDRMLTLTRLQNTYPHYRCALSAADGETYVTEVSRSWSSLPNRAQIVLKIHDEWKNDAPISSKVQSADA
jgi:flagellum-specific peptidoglycan hydrolase FlgJ